MLRIEVYHILQVLRRESSIIDFQVLLSQAMTYFEEKLVIFYEYMKTRYATCSEQWATCYRKFAPVGTNMAIEAFHRVLRIDYLMHKQNCRLDHLLHILFKKIHKTAGKLSQGLMKSGTSLKRFPVYVLQHVTFIAKNVKFAFICILVPALMP